MTSVNPFYAGRIGPSRLKASVPRPAWQSAPIDKVIIGKAALYRADCFDLLPGLHDIDAVVTDPPYGIGYKYRSYDDAPQKYDALMERLVPQLIRLTPNGPCFSVAKSSESRAVASILPKRFSHRRGL